MRRLMLAAAVAAIAMSAAAAVAQPVPLIERAKLFGNPTKSAGRISPDGKWLSWVAPRDGVMNVWIAPTSDPAKARPMTAEKKRPVQGYFWAPDSNSILFVTDNGGDENFKVYGVDVTTGTQTALTPFDKTRAQIVAVSRNVKDRILVGLNNRDPRWHDVHSLDLKTGALSLVFKNEGFGSFLADDGLNLRLAIKPRGDGGQEIYAVEGQAASAKPMAVIEPEDALTTAPAGYTADGATLYWVDSRGRNTAALIAQDVKTGGKTILGEDPRADVQGGLVEPRTGRIQAYGVNYLRHEWRPLDAGVKADLDFLKSRLKGQFAVSSRTDDDTLWTVAEDRVVEPTTLWLYDRKARTVTKLYTGRPELEGAPLQPMHPVEIKTRDGFTEVSYLTLPPGSDANGDGRPEKAVPLVLLVHGGPWGRDAYGYHGVHQWLANRGYAVLSPNFRASTGFGKAWINAGDKQWGRKMHDDLLDAVDWAVKAGVTRPDTVAIMGGSYGGYATLAGLAFTPDRFACGVDIVGPSNLNTLLKTIPPYWQSIRAQFVRSMGDPDTAEGQALLKERSPLTKADQIRKPLLIGQGANDPRVNKAESDQIVEAMKAKGIPVTYVLFPDEGHGFARPENNLAFYATTEHFLERCLGGRAEPFGRSLQGSSMQVVYGAEFSPGLKAAVDGAQTAAK
ncbi:MAG: S9 family peptidase [Phenylobacterium sp.]|uniref:S9 family peptidase n=1 Tax=Phenylobacterium sp. TaxID=1871053 RepID=UPI0011FB81D3|nr:S9 family peptidase [Phenylobacterium sp.]TAJ68401.1 MAG: S9 family peptidase [Phenylobacterium sp.]